MMDHQSENSKQNKKYFIKNNIIYQIPTIIGGLIPFVKLTIFTRILTPDDYGLLALATVYAVFLTGLVNFGMMAAYDRGFFQYRDDLKKTGQQLYSVLFFVLFNFLIAISLTIVFKSKIAALVMGTPDQANLICYVFFATFLGSVNYYYYAYFRNSENAKRYVLYQITARLISLVVSILLVVYFRIGILGIVFGLIVSEASIFILLSYKIIKQVPLAFSKSILKDTIKIAYPLAPKTFLGVVGSQFDKFLIGMLNTIGGVGIYSIAQKISYSVFTIMTGMENVFLPRIYKSMFSNKENKDEILGPQLTPYIYISIFFAMLVSVFSKEIIMILTPESYHGATNIVMILAMYYGVLFFGKVNSNQLIFAKKTYVITVITVLRIVLTIGLNLFFIIRWGALGAAWATFLVGLVVGVVSFFWAQHYYTIQWEYKRVCVIYGLFMSVSVMLITMNMNDVNYYACLAIKGAVLVLFSYIGVRIKIINKENFTIIKDILLFRKKAVAD